MPVDQGVGSDNPYGVPKAALTVPEAPSAESADDLWGADSARRFGAWILDAGIYYMLYFLALTLYFAAQGGGLGDLRSDWKLTVSSLAIRVAWCAVWDSSGLMGTPGKRFLSLAVVNQRAGRLSFGDALVRNLVKWISLSLCGLTALSVLGDSPGRSIWDGVAKSKVIDRRTPGFGLS